MKTEKILNFIVNLFVSIMASIGVIGIMVVLLIYDIVPNELLYIPGIILAFLMMDIFKTIWTTK